MPSGGNESFGGRNWCSGMEVGVVAVRVGGVAVEAGDLAVEVGVGVVRITE